VCHQRNAVVLVVSPISVSREPGVQYSTVQYSTVLPIESACDVCASTILYSDRTAGVPTSNCLLCCPATQLCRAGIQWGTGLDCHPHPHPSMCCRRKIPADCVCVCECEYYPSPSHCWDAGHTNTHTAGTTVVQKRPPELYLSRLCVRGPPYYVCASHQYISLCHSWWMMCPGHIWHWQQQSIQQHARWSVLLVLCCRRHWTEHPAKFFRIRDDDDDEWSCEQIPESTVPYVT